MTVGHLKTVFAQVAGNLKSQILKSSNSRRLPGEGMLKFRIDRYIRFDSSCAPEISSKTAQFSSLGRVKNAEKNP